MHVYDRTTKVSILLTEPRARGGGAGSGAVGMSMGGTEYASLPQTVDTTAGQRELVLWDNQTVMRGLLKRGDIIAIAEAYIPDETDSNGRRWLEYGSNTIIYVLSSDPFEADSSCLSQSLSQALVVKHAAAVAAATVASQQHVSDGRSGEGFSSLEGAGAGAGEGGGSAETVDCEANEGRVYISELRPGMRHVSLIGLVAGVSGNMPVVTLEGGSGRSSGSGNGKGQGDPTSITDRYCIRLRDGTGSVNITVWGAAAAGTPSSVNDPLVRECAKLCVGQAVLLEGVRVRQLPAGAAAGGVGGDGGSVGVLPFAASCSKKSGGALKCISTLPSIICLQQPGEALLLSQVLPQMPGNTIIKAVITACTAAGSALPTANPSGSRSGGAGGGSVGRNNGGGGAADTGGSGGDSAVISVHSDCNRPIAEYAGVQCCPFCRKRGPGIAVKQEFDINCTIDDGSRSFVATLSPSAAATLFGAAQGWAGLSRSEQAAQLKSVVCRSYIMVVSSGVSSGAGGALLRIDAVGSDSATAQLSFMLQQIGAVVNA